MDIRFTKKGDCLYAFLLNRPEGATLTIPALRAAQGATVSLLGGGNLEWSDSNGNLIVKTGPLQGEYVSGPENDARAASSIVNPPRFSPIFGESSGLCSRSFKRENKKEMLLPKSEY